MICLAGLIWFSPQEESNFRAWMLLASAFELHEYAHTEIESELLAPKLLRNKLRDAENRNKLRKAGWRSLVLWNAS